MASSDDKTSNPSPWRPIWKRPGPIFAAVISVVVAFNTYLGVKTDHNVQAGLFASQKIERGIDEHEKDNRISINSRSTGEALQTARNTLSTSKEVPAGLIYKLAGIAQRLIGIKDTPMAVDEADRKKAERLESQFASLYEETKKKYYEASSDKEKREALEGMISILEQWAEALQNLLGEGGKPGSNSERVASGFPPAAPRGS